MGWGDDLMVLGEAQAKSKELNGKPVIVVNKLGQVCKSKLFYKQAGITDEPRPEHLIIRMGEGGRPYIAGNTPEGRVWKRYKPQAPNLIFTEQELEFTKNLPKKFIVIEPYVKNGAGKQNKDWGFENYQKIVSSMRNVCWVQIGEGKKPALKGVTYVTTPSFKHGCAVLSKSFGYLGPEGGLHHASAAVKVPAVVIFGGYISPEVTGYPGHINLFSGQDLGCGKHQKCSCDCMERISIDQVSNAVRQMLGSKSNCTQPDVA